MIGNFSNEMDNFPTIDLGDVVLRKKQEEDVEDFFAYYSNPNVNRYILCNIPTNLDEAKMEYKYWARTFERKDGIYFAIARKSDNKVIGSAGLTSYNSYQGRIEISYDLAEQYWNKGIMSAVVNSITKLAFFELHDLVGKSKINRIEAFVSVENDASKHLLKKCGYTLEGILRQHRYHRGSYVDVYCFSIVRSDLD